MTTTAGPGISLMSEFVGLGYFAEIPVVLFDVQRMGPSTGLPTRTSQGDILSAATLSHGDTRHPLFIPANPAEAFEMAAQAFDLAEELQTPVFVMLDLDLGMNYWMSDKFEYSDKPLARGKVLSAEDLERLDGFKRYADVDGDGVPYRTLPGTKHPKAAYFTRGTGHTPSATYSEREDDWTENMARLVRKFETARKKMPAPEVVMTEGAKIGFLGCGTSHFAIEESRDQLEKEHGVKTSYYRTRGYPFSSKMVDFVNAHDRVYVVDQNRDGQLLQLLRLDYPDLPNSKLRSIRYIGGLPLDARTVTDDLIKQEAM